MLNLIHRILMTLGATLGMVGIYAIKAHWIIHPHVPFWITGLSIFLLAGCISFLCLSVGKSLSHDEIKTCTDIRLIDQEMIRPYYLYMVLAVVSPDALTFGFVYFLVFVLHYKLQSQFSNPWFFLQGFTSIVLKPLMGQRFSLFLKGRSFATQMELASPRSADTMTLPTSAIAVSAVQMQSWMRQNDFSLLSIPFLFLSGIIFIDQRVRLFWSFSD